MARESYEDWLPIEADDEAVHDRGAGSHVLRLARKEPMRSDTDWVPRSGTFAVASVPKGGAYGETTGSNDYVQLDARKIGGITRIAEEDLLDSTADIIKAKKIDAVRHMGFLFDNATLGTSGAANGSTVPYDSVYRLIRTTDASAGYTADTNYVSGSATYANLSLTLSKVEDSIWAVQDVGDGEIIASPLLKQSVRGIVDNVGRPIFVEGKRGKRDSLFGYPINWTLAARTSATASPFSELDATIGNPLLIFVSPEHLIVGKARLSPGIANRNGYALQHAYGGAGFSSDEALFKAVFRRGFKVANPKGFAVFEKTS